MVCNPGTGITASGSIRWFHMVPYRSYVRFKYGGMPQLRRTTSLTLLLGSPKIEEMNTNGQRIKDGQAE
jgi:hypothetical protein